jgi:YjbR
MPREDLLDWARYKFRPLGLGERKTFSCPSFYVGKKMFAFLYEDGLCIKLPPNQVAAAVEANPDVYRNFEPGKGVMKNWLLMVHPEVDEYESEWQRIEIGLQMLQ